MTTLIELVERATADEVRRRKRAAIDRLEKPLEKELGKIFDRQGRDMVKRLGALRNQFPLEEAPSLSAWDKIVWLVLRLRKSEKAMERALNRSVRRALREGGLEVQRQLGFSSSFDLKNPRAVKYMDDHGAKLVTRINRETRDRMRTILRSATDAGWSWTRTQTMIKRSFKGFSTSRAHLIARTEMAFAYEHAIHEQGRSLTKEGIGLEKRWLTVGDDRVDEVCADNEADDWIPFKDSFGSGSGQPPEHPACRCATQLRVEGTSG